MSNDPRPIEPPAPYFGVFDLFKIGIGPSSSHSVGPMKAAGAFLGELAGRRLLPAVDRVQVDLYGSLALTGLGHGTDTAVLMGLLGERPDLIDPDSIPTRLAEIRESGRIRLDGSHEIAFREETDLVFNRRIVLDAHPNGIRFRAYHGRDAEDPIHDSTYFSIGGGFIVRQGEEYRSDSADQPEVPYPFASGRDLLELTDRRGCSISDLALENERAFRPDTETSAGLRRIWEAMQECVSRGCRAEGILPGGLGIERRAPGLLRVLRDRAEESLRDPMAILDWVDLYALAVNEENAAGGRVVTAPTNGAAGIIPAVLHYFVRFCPESTPGKVERFLLTAAAIGSLYKRNASISGAEVGCQGEVGVACSMAAGALTEVLGGNPRQVEEAAEIGMEHNLGLTCDPIKGLVQVPCIERNAMGAVKAINASRLALRGDGQHFVSLDRVIRVMKRTGADMSSRYKETSEGGLAVNISEC
ncbi:L-serine ammonia-lyase [Tautonia plasticadhaerens]|uniref:L-serine dehydratase n=1 Tax=Tautonia plasticadhaerens TaxID=2527974 RepID=A0A518GVQ4_9BACT|nr:L-serine ammonia-lyase [Tautonia plasticadhaerens]QDV32674.1 L-serine dehydratase 2 [Tautonia plasticadhaerens]